MMDAYAAMKVSSADGIRPLVRLLVNREINGAAAEDAQSACAKRLPEVFVAIDSRHCRRCRCMKVTSLLARIAGRVFGKMPNSAFGHATLWLGRAVSDALAGDSRIGDFVGSGAGRDCQRLTPLERIRSRCSCRQRTELRPINKMIQVDHRTASILCDIAPARRCGSNWRNCGKFDGTPRKAYGSCVRRNSWTARHGSSDLPRLARFGRRRKHARPGDRFISQSSLSWARSSGKSPKPRSTNRFAPSCSSS